MMQLLASIRQAKPGGHGVLGQLARSGTAVHTRHAKTSADFEPYSTEAKLSVFHL